MTDLVRPRRLEEAGTTTLALRLTLLTLLFAAADSGYKRTVLLLLIVPGLLFPAVLRTPAVWIGIAAVIAASIVREWPLSDNHIYLFVYWSLAIFLALCTRSPSESLSVSARWLIVFVFLLATLWKAFLSPDYLDGRFFRVQLLSDNRFSPVVQMFSGLSREQIAENRAYLQPLPERRAVANPRLVEPPALRRIGAFLTWSTVLLEGAVALAFLFRWGRYTEFLRHGLLLLFCVAAYAIAPVAGFGWVIAIMGLAQVPERQRLLQAAYVAVWLLILLYNEVPWVQKMLQLAA